MREMVSAVSAAARRRFQKIMSPVSWPRGCLGEAGARSIDPELTRHPRIAHFAAATRPCATDGRRLTMQWQKPQATDLRYGFEITMYISNR